MIEQTRSELIKEAITHIMNEVGGRKVFYEMLGETYKSGKVTRQTVSQWVTQGEIPAAKAMKLASWSKGKYTAEQLCSILAN